jgi:ubiquinone/menaquinone biosynthesis C-methylase UbiE
MLQFFQTTLFKIALENGMIMEKDELGLPLEYQELPEYFDAYNINEDTEAKNRIIEKILHEHKVETVLDLTCGTGSQVFYLKKRGYKVIGADFSPALLDIARKKTRKEKIDVRFIDGDMRTLKVGHFDAVITIDNAIGHLTKPDFEEAMKNIHENLKNGGIYVFDILNLEAMTDSVVNDLATDVRKTVDDTQIHAVQTSTLDREKGRLTSYDHLTIQKGSESPKEYKSNFSLQVYTAKELREMLARNGFETVYQSGFEGEKFVEDKTLSILTVTRKQ